MAFLMELLPFSVGDDAGGSCTPVTGTLGHVLHIETLWCWGWARHCAKGAALPCPQDLLHTEQGHVDALCFMSAHASVG